MNRSRWHKHLPIAVLVVGGGIAIAQSQTGEAVFPYVGYLEENGFAVTGERTVRVDLFATANAAESPCRSQTFSPVDLHAGRFQVEVTVPRAGGVYDACLAGGELFAGIAVGAADAAAGDLVALTSGVGGDRVRIGSVPFAAASPKAVPLLVADSAQVEGDVLAGGTVSANALSANSAAINGALTANSARVTGALKAGSAAIDGALSATTATLSGTLSSSAIALQTAGVTSMNLKLNTLNGVDVQPPVNPAAGDPLFRVLSLAGTERLRVEHSGQVLMNNNLKVTGKLLVGEQMGTMGVSNNFNVSTLAIIVDRTQVCDGIVTAVANTGGSATALDLTGFIDFDNDGTFDAGEQNDEVARVTLSATAAMLVFPVRRNLPYRVVKAATPTNATSMVARFTPTSCSQ